DDCDAAAVRHCCVKQKEEIKNAEVGMDGEVVAAAA
ncbi:hypothetical protein A2U01_0069383, partial [Trifolium medium]|nr:hypothetical protein [Trifolium medium]